MTDLPVKRLDCSECRGKSLLDCGEWHRRRGTEYIAQQIGEQICSVLLAKEKEDSSFSAGCSESKRVCSRWHKPVGICFLMSNVCRWGSDSVKLSLMHDCILMK